MNTNRGSPNLDNSVSCANLNSGKENSRTASLGETIDLSSNQNLADEDYTRSTIDIYSSKKHNTIENRIKSSKSETPLNDLNISTGKLATTIGRRDLIFNPLTKISNLGRGLQNISLISRRYNRSFLSTEELERLTERKKNSKSLIIEIE